MAKTVIVKIDGQLAMAVVSATKDVYIELLRRQTASLEVKLAHESEFADRFQGCQIGAAPPFGNLFGMETFLDRDLARSTEFAFPAGTHTDVIVMPTADYLRLAQPILARFGVEILAAGLAGT